MTLFSRNEMAHMLVQLRDHASKQVSQLVRSALAKQAATPTQANGLPTTLSPIIKKLMNLENKNERILGFSISDMVALGNEMESSQFSVTTVQNWVKRDVKELIATPQSGKKYSVEQVATVYVIDDLKASLDFDAIRRVLHLIFNDPSSDEDDLIHPVDFFSAYTDIFETVRHVGTPVKLVVDKARLYVEEGLARTDTERRAIESAIVVAVLSLQASHYQRMAKTLAEGAILTSELQRL